MYAETTGIYVLLLLLVGTLGDSRKTDDNYCKSVTDRHKLVTQDLSNDQRAALNKVN